MSGLGQNPITCKVGSRQAMSHSIGRVGHQGIVAMNDASEDALSPDRFVDGVLGYLNSAALKGALDLDLFTTIPETDGTAEAIAARVQASPRGVRILCDFLTVNGFLR